MRHIIVYMLLTIFTLQSSVVAAGAISENLIPAAAESTASSEHQPHDHAHSHDEYDNHDEQHHCHGHFHFMAALIPDLLTLNVRIHSPHYLDQAHNIHPHYRSSPKRPPIHA